MKATIALVDDHALLRNGLASLLTELGYSVLFQADNGRQFIEKLNPQALPQVVLMDISMPVMDGYETTAWLKKNHKQVNVLVLSMLEDERSMIRMIKNGAKGYILKDTEPEELEKAIEAILKKGFYHSEMVSGKLIRAINHLDEKDEPHDEGDVPLTEKEIAFLKWLCTDFSYKEIADKMAISPRTLDSYRDILQQKLGCKGRIGLVLWTIKQGYVVI